MALEDPKEPVTLTREEMQVGMRVMLPDGQMHGQITSITDEGMAVHFDGTRTPMEYDWKYANFLVKEE